VRMAYVDKVWAIVGGIDGPSTHLAEQVVAKACLPLVSPVSGDKTVNLAHVPWMFSLLPGDHLQAPVVAAAVSDRVGAGPFILVSGVDHDSRLFTQELSKCLGARHLVPRYQFELSPEKAVAGQIIARVIEAKPQAVVLVAGTHQSALLVAGLREAGFPGLVFGSAAMGRRRFLEEAGDAAERVFFPLLYSVGCVERTGNEKGAFHAPYEGRFAEAFEARTGKPPDYAAAHAYDAFRLLIAAVRTAGLNRARIRDALSALSPWSGVTGTVQWDPLGANSRPVALGTIQHGRVVPATQRAAANAG
jgi:branched-chain amino acid transport system substrate-binding protein